MARAQSSSRPRPRPYGLALQPFAALNAVFVAEGYVLAPEPGTVLEAPIEIIHLASGPSEAPFHTAASQ